MKTKTRLSRKCVEVKNQSLKINVLDQSNDDFQEDIVLPRKNSLKVSSEDTTNNSKRPAKGTSAKNNIYKVCEKLSVISSVERTKSTRLRKQPVQNNTNVIVDKGDIKEKPSLFIGGQGILKANR